ncbi:MAG TPA: GNAT family N-acetyltransferase [Thermoplasmata archaeon]|nr:GNAT family N-acetyltransferase [Thermoplasmata archaeon]
MNGLDIRHGTETDHPALVVYYDGGEGPLDQFVDLERLQRLPPEGLLVAEVDGKIVGFLYWFRHRKPFFDPAVDEYAMIHELHVFEDFQRRGIGRALLARAVEDIRTCGIGTVYIDTMDYNAPARALYESAGFRELFRDVHYKLEL